MDGASGRLIILKVLRAPITAFSSVTGHNTKILLRGLTRPEQSVVAIANGDISGWSVGSTILSGPEHDQGFAAVIAAAESSSGYEPAIIPD
jgi:predicted transcriptional regulator YheO